MEKKDIIERLQELYIYDLYGFKRELKALSMILLLDEKINCVATAIIEGKRRFVCVTDYRVIILFTPIVGIPENTVVLRKAIVDYSAEKKFFKSGFSFSTKDMNFKFRNTQKRIIDLFLWSMEQPIKEYEN